MRPPPKQPPIPPKPDRPAPNPAVASPKPSSPPTPILSPRAGSTQDRQGQAQPQAQPQAHHQGQLPLRESRKQGIQIRRHMGSFQPRKPLERRQKGRQPGKSSCDPWETLDTCSVPPRKPPATPTGKFCQQGTRNSVGYIYWEENIMTI